MIQQTDIIKTPGTPIKRRTLRKQFVVRMLLIMMVVALTTGGIQFWLMYQQINQDMNHQANMIAETIHQGMVETEMAAAQIERQIDLKLESMSIRGVDYLNGKSSEEITEQDLKRIQNELGFAGITIMARRGDDIIGVQSTDPEEIGFSMKEFSPLGYKILDDILQGKTLGPDAMMLSSYANENIGILYAAQSGAHDGEPVFYKYAYYHEPGTDFIFSPYIEASEVNQFVEKVGPNAWIEKVKRSNPYALEIAVLDPRVFADPSLEQKLYPPLKKVVNGEYTYGSQKDTEILIGMMESPEKRISIETVQNEKVYKIFMPLNDQQVVYMAFDYSKMSGPLFKLSIILIVIGFAALAAVVMLTASFFNKIYANIQKIINQIKRLEEGDLTVHSLITDSGELADLSDSANKMTDALNLLVKETNAQANKVERLSLLLETDANQSVEKVYTMSVETTADSREKVEEMNIFLNQIEELLNEGVRDERTVQLLQEIGPMRTIARDHAQSTTEMTITLSDLLKSLHGQSRQLAEISRTLLNQLKKFKLDA